MFHFLGFLFLLILILFFFGLSIIGWLLRTLFGFGKRSTRHNTYTSDKYSNATNDNTGRDNTSDTPKRKKIFEADEGEYVEFEEMKEND